MISPRPCDELPWCSRELHAIREESGYHPAIPSLLTTPDAPLAQYAFRRSVLEQARTYSLYPDRIEIEGGMAQTHMLRDVRRVHLKYEHTKQREYYQCFIHTARGRINLRHVDWQGPGDFKDQRATYTPFVMAVLAQLAPLPNVQFRAGSMANFVAALAGIPIMTALGMLALAHHRYGSAALAGLMAGICLIMIGPSRPRRFAPLAPPEDMLPQATQ